VGLLARLGEVTYTEGPLTAGGKPSKEFRVFSLAALERAQNAWNYAQQCAANWADKAGTFGGTLANLSPLAQSAVLTLRSKTRLPMRGELLDVLLELNEAGLLSVHAEGHATLRVPVKSLKLPQGRPLRIERLAA
jgi:Lon protease-like protein